MAPIPGTTSVKKRFRSARFLPLPPNLADTLDGAFIETISYR